MLLPVSVFVGTREVLSQNLAGVCALWCTVMRHEGEGQSQFGQNVSLEPSTCLNGSSLSSGEAGGYISCHFLVPYIAPSQALTLSALSLPLP